MLNNFKHGLVGKFLCKIRKKVKIRNQYNQAPYLIQDTIWESDKTQNITHKTAKRSALSQQVTTKDSQKKHCLGTVSKNNYWRA